MSETSSQCDGGGEAALHEILAALRAPRKEGEPACALCLRTARSVVREVRAFFSEYVNDPQSRDGWRNARGFCAEHTSVLAALGDSLAVAILYADLADLTSDRWQSVHERPGLLAGLRRGNTGVPIAPCPACAMTRAADARNAAALAQALAQARSVIWQALEASEGLCVAHTEQVMALAAPSVAARLRRCEAQRLAALKAELEEIIRKNDYRFRGEPWGAEKDAWLRALQKLKRPRV